MISRFQTTKSFDSGNFINLLEARAGDANAFIDSKLLCFPEVGLLAGLAGLVAGLAGLVAGLEARLLTLILKL